MVSACLDALPRHRRPPLGRCTRGARSTGSSGRTICSSALYDPLDRRLPRRAARRSAQREPGRGIDALVPARAASTCAPPTALDVLTAVRAGAQATVMTIDGSITRRSSIATQSNPILTAADWPYPAHTVFNAGATRLRDGTTLLLCRVEDRRGHSHLCAARSANGVDGWIIDERADARGRIPSTIPRSCGASRTRASRSSRSSGKYAVAYTAFSKGGPGVALALTEDFRTFERCGLVMQPDDKDAALLPRRIDGIFALIHRPMHDSGAHVWISYSPDLRNWGGHKLMLQARRGGVVGREQGRALAAAHRDAARLADALPRRPAHRGGQPLSPRRRALRSRHSRSTACCAAIRGSSAPRRPTSATATSATSPSPAATPSATTATPSTSTTARRTPASRWPPAASASSCAGSTSTAARRARSGSG